MAKIPLTFPPGIYRNSTPYAARGRFTGCNQIRFINGRYEPIGGWTRGVATTLSGKPRGITAWRSNDQKTRYLAVGTHSRLYVWNDSSLLDITPTSPALTVGRPDTIYGLGYGQGAYGDGEYGVARTSTTGNIYDATTWSLDQWGQELVACSTADGRVWKWDLSASTAAVVTNAPVDCTAIVVTEEFHLLALGAGGNARRVDWCSRQDLTTWTTAATNTAGNFDLQTTGRLLAGRRTRGQTLLWTDVDVHAVNYVGSPLVYGFDRVGQNCGAIGPLAMASSMSAAYWMGRDRFYVYDGYVRELQCDVHDHVFRDITQLQTHKIACGLNSRFGEIWWFYPSASSVENDRYVVYSIRENHWTIGEMARTCWQDSGPFRHIFAATPDGIIHRHEEGMTADGSTRVGDIWIEYAPVELGNGDTTMRLHAIVPDASEGIENVQARIKGRYHPTGPETVYGPFDLSTTDGRTPVRVTTRQAQLRIEWIADAQARVGINRIDVTPGGRR